MRIRGKAAASWRAAVVATTLLWAATTVVAKSDTPSLKVTDFQGDPFSFNYFGGSDAILSHQPNPSTIWRSGDGGISWAKVGDVPDKEAFTLIMHSFDPKRAYVIGQGHKHWKTTDRGESWTEFTTEVETSAFQGGDILRFNGADPDRIIFNGMKCQAIFCDEEAMYTTDNFGSSSRLRGNTAGCWWARSTAEFRTGNDKLDKQRVLCIARDPFSPFKEDQRLMISDTFFNVKDNTYTEFEPEMDTTRGVAGVNNVATVKGYILVATMSFNTDEMALFITDDTDKWHRAMFPTYHGHTVNQHAYTVLESTDHSIQIDVMTTRPSNPMGVLFTSNSNGTYFTENLEYTNRNTHGLVDFEDVTAIQGIFIVNEVENGKEVMDSSDVEKEIVTKITFDDGHTFRKLKLKDDKDEHLHLHSMTRPDNIGKVFSSPAPGLVMGNGNKGRHLADFYKSNLYVSDDAGVTWARAGKLEGPHKYKFGDEGSVLVAVKDSKNVDVSEFSYSLDHGMEWKQVSFPDGLKIKPLLLTTSEDSSTLKFVIVGKTEKEADKLISIDFEELHERTCKDDDMEDFHARVDEDGKPTCLMGHKQSFRRRKKTADCFIKKAFEKPEPKTEKCPCTDADFECDYNFELEDNKCVQKGKLIDEEGVCKGKDGDDTFKGSSGYRRIPGNECTSTDGKQKDDPVERKCSESNAPSSSPHNGGNPGHDRFVFDTDLKDMEIIYLQRGDTSSGDDETVIVRPAKFMEDSTELADKKLWRTTNHGKSWERILKDEEILNIYPHPHINDAVFFTTKNLKKVVYTVNRGNNFHHFELEHELHGSMPLVFHPNRVDWIMAIVDYDGSQIAILSEDRGDHWRTIVHNVKKCEFTGHDKLEGTRRSIKQIVCIAKKDESNSPLGMVVSDDFFDEERMWPEIGQGDIDVKDFASMSEFIVVADAPEDKDGLLAFTTIDGKNYSKAQFPSNFQDLTNREFTVLDSSTHAVNLFVATEMGKNKKHGNIFKSNSNGTEYVLSAVGVNCGEDFYTDFEKIPGLEGVSVINTVANRDKLDGGKKLQTKITHDDGGQWLYLPPPKSKDSFKPPCSSSKGDARCALHLHGYSEREDKRDGFAAETAVGLMFGVGNVGPTLEKMADADTFMTRDAGVTWEFVQKGVWRWQYGDKGSILVLVKQFKPKVQEDKTNSVLYSTDEGRTWQTYEFSEEKVEVFDLTALRSGSSRNFIVWARTDKGQTAINIDFTGLATEPCEEKDYTQFTPQHPEGGDGCLFGHKRTYLRKKLDSKCYNAYPVKNDLTAQNCQCKRQDFECAYNFELDNSKQCKLVKGLKPLTAEEWCAKNVEAKEFPGVTGYRKIPLTTCSGGKEMDKSFDAKPCPGFEDEFRRKHRVSGLAIFFAVTIPFALAGAAGWWVWRNWQRKFGQIRLGESGGFGFDFDSDSPWVRYPVVALSAIVAVVAALPLVATSLWRSATSAYRHVAGGGGGGGSWLSAAGSRPFTTRDSFARSTGDYGIVDDDEGELLGDDSDEEV